MNNDTYVIVPVYNEASIIGKTINELSEHFKNVVCVNDGSKDNSSEMIKDTKAILIEHAINLGQGAAIQTGVAFALRQPQSKYLITFDADGQHGVKDALKMLGYLKKGNCNIVLGSRFLGTSENISKMKSIFLKLARLFSNSVSGVKLSDSHVGLRVFDRQFAQTLNLSMNDFSHATEIIDRIKQYGYGYKEVPITVTYSVYSKSKGQPMFNSVNIAIDTLLKKFTKW